MIGLRRENQPDHRRIPRHRLRRVPAIGRVVRRCPATGHAGDRGAGWTPATAADFTRRTHALTPSHSGEDDGGLLSGGVYVAGTNQFTPSVRPKCQHAFCAFQTTTPSASSVNVKGEGSLTFCFVRTSRVQEI